MIISKALKYDLYRYGKKTTKFQLLKTYLSVPSFNYIVWFRITQKYNNIFTKYLLKRKMIKFGIEIHPETKINNGFYIGHWGGIVINSKVMIGNNCNISQGVTIGSTKKGVPIINNNVYIGPGAKIFGNVTIGSNVSIGANAVVTKDIPDNGVAVGIPATVISYNGSKDYINNILIEE